MNVPVVPVTNPQRDLNGRNLAKTIFRAELPEQFVRTFSAQSLYLSIKQNGLHSSTDLLAIATMSQFRLFLDFDLWDRDRLNEQNFWDWLALTDDENSLELLQKLIKAIDLKLIALIIGKYVEVVTFDEPADVPPQENFYTPDRGRCWIRVNLEDQSQHFSLTRLLALLYETSADLFYKLTALPSMNSLAYLEEESYQERNKRISAEGIPDEDTAHELNQPIALSQCNQLVVAAKRRELISDIATIEPLVYITDNIEPLQSLLQQIISTDECQAEMSFLLNAAIVHWRIDYYDIPQLELLIAKVRGALNIGLERLLQKHSLPALDIYETLGLQKIYRLGLEPILALKKQKANFKDLSATDEKQLILQGLDHRFPEFPNALQMNGSFTAEQGKISTTMRAFQQLEEVELIQKILLG